MKVICIFYLERKIICIYTYIFIHTHTYIYIHQGISSCNYHAQSLEWCPTLREPINCSLPGSSVYGIFQARILKWVTIPSSRDLPNPGFEPTSAALQVHPLLLSHWGSQYNFEAWKIPRSAVYKLETQETQWYSSSSMSLKADKTNTQLEDSKAEKANSLVLLLLLLLLFLRPSGSCMRLTQISKDNLFCPDYKFEC